MALIYLVRHGQAQAGWGEEKDPGLSDVGHHQAAAVAKELFSLGPMPIVTSPLARTRETAKPLCRMWRVTPNIEPRVAEIPSPPQTAADRIPWLKKIMAGAWPNMEEKLQMWRAGVIDALCSLRENTAVFSHFIAINAAVGEATGNQNVVAFRPDNTSVTVLRSSGGRLHVVKLGREDRTLVL